jgi:hypothetical protein
VLGIALAKNAIVDIVGGVMLGLVGAKGESTLPKLLIQVLPSYNSLQFPFWKTVRVTARLKIAII